MFTTVALAADCVPVDGNDLVAFVQLDTAPTPRPTHTGTFHLERSRAWTRLAILFANRFAPRAPIPNAWQNFATTWPIYADQAGRRWTKRPANPP